MAFQHRHEEMKSKLPEVKFLFQSRQYRQCASLCERILHEGVAHAHPVHYAYLHFYGALSHESTARGMHNFSSTRLPTLELAEKHYLAAVTALSSAPTNVVLLPTLSPIREQQSPTPDRESFPGSRRTSVAPSLGSRSSHESLSTAATAFSDSESDEVDYTLRHSKYFVRPPPSRGILDDFALTPKHSHLKSSIQPTTSFTLIQPAVDVHVEHFNLHLSSFLSLLQGHLVSVRELKGDPSTARIERSRFCDSVPGSRSCSRDIKSGVDDEDLVRARWERNRMSFRKRFDPNPIEDLCRQALAEL